MDPYYSNSFGMSRDDRRHRNIFGLGSVVAMQMTLTQIIARDIRIRK